MYKKVYNQHRYFSTCRFMYDMHNFDKGNKNSSYFILRLITQLPVSSFCVIELETLKKNAFLEQFYFFERIIYSEMFLINNC